MLAENFRLMAIIDDRRLNRAKNEGLGLAPEVLRMDAPASVAGPRVDLDQIAEGREDRIGRALRQTVTCGSEFRKRELEVGPFRFLDDCETAGASTNFLIPGFAEIA